MSKSIEVVKSEDVDTLISLYRERDRWQEWSHRWEQCHKKIESHLETMKQNTIEISVE